MTSEATGKATDFQVHEEMPFNGGPPVTTLADRYLTPVALLFVRGHGPVPRVDRASFRLRVEGAVARPLALSLDELAAGFERVEVTAALQCAGLRRDELMAEADIPGELPWGGDAIGNARWGGVRLTDVLAAAGAEGGGPGAHVGFRGLDEVPRPDGAIPFGASIPAAKAGSPEVILADRLGGEPLPALHGGPLRALVPGYIGARSVKWLAEIRVQAEPSTNHFQRVAYRLTPGRPGDPLPAAPGPMLGDLDLNSAITDPLPGTRLAPGAVRVRGWAVAGGGACVERVELSADGGATWRPCRFLDPADPWAWRRWEAEVELPAGDAMLTVRAFDDAGAGQPADRGRVWNRKGYMNNAWHRVPVRVGGG